MSDYFDTPAVVMAKQTAIENDLANRQNIVIKDCGYETPCWVWIKARTPAGYGDGWFDGVHTYAHRYTFERLHGFVPPPPLHLDHLCSSRPCCNPLHLEPVTPTTNARRGRKAKLTEVQVSEILASSESQRELARRFGVTHQTIFYYKSGQYEHRRQRWTEHG